MNKKNSIDTIVECIDCKQFQNKTTGKFYEPTQDEREKIYENFLIKREYCNPCLKEVMKDIKPYN